MNTIHMPAIQENIPLLEKSLREGYIYNIMCYFVCVLVYCVCVGNDIQTLSNHDEGFDLNR